MVHIQNIELAHFKSFSGITKVPFFPGFTVISGPNGSGKSNILDAILFCLGLASSRGMRAERLPDLISHHHTQQRKTAEAYVSVTFDLGEEKTHKVTRRLRATQGGNYTSTYYINEQSCTLTELHQELNRLRIYPEGYNVVLQGDVTRIITMNNRERREIIDELAGVAEFDRKIEQTKQTLAEVRTTEERYQIIVEELTKISDRLSTDCLKAEKYQQLKLTIQEKQNWLIVINWRLLQEQQQQLITEINQDNLTITQLETGLASLTISLQQANDHVNHLNQQVKAMGEEQQLTIAANLATAQAKHQQQVKLKHNLENKIIKLQQSINENREQVVQYQENLTELSQQQEQILNQIPSLTQQQEQLQQTVQQTEDNIKKIAQNSAEIIQQQSQINQEINQIQNDLSNYQKIVIKNTEKCNNLEEKLKQNRELLNQQEEQLISKQTETDYLNSQLAFSETELQSLAAEISQTEQEINLAQVTTKRLNQEEREIQRQLDKIEANKQAQGTYTSNIILQAQIPGIHGLVAQLGQVEPRYQLALEIAGGGRLGYLVVSDDQVAAEAIKFLKTRNAGRATFLPLNKIKAPQIIDTVALRYAPGYLDLAVNLITCASQYRTIFAYVFGNTIVFDSLESARAYLGKYRIVTLDGDILETTGAMTGGSTPQRNTLHFGVVDNQESSQKMRLEEITQILTRNEALIVEKSHKLAQLKQDFTDLRQQQLKQQLRQERLREEIQGLNIQQERLNRELTEFSQELEAKNQQINQLNPEIARLSQELSIKQQSLQELEGAGIHQEWQNQQIILQNQLGELKNIEQEIQKIQSLSKEITSELERVREKIRETEENISATERESLETAAENVEINQEIAQTLAEIAASEEAIAQLSTELLAIKQERDLAENNLRDLQQQQQQQTWELEKLKETQTQRQQRQNQLQETITNQSQELPNPLPEIPTFTASLSEQSNLIQKEVSQLQKRLEGIGPVNMLALAEYQENQERLETLKTKLSTLEAERTELLLRIETFTTARLQAFQEAFTVVNQNFESIFATLSEGDGYLQLENPENPFSGGLNLVAHPKGKPVQRLSSMSGGEKSLTALSFIFALQLYRPSPFYVFDEVDMFLDGANVEKLAKMIKHQAQQAQFIVVSLRRPMIEASERTIGVTQARGASTQVLGVKW
ncbi:MAG: chromosome segregation protein SMC [Gloeocapsa sp. DLM2.Bin57]|nr:MAG: chromosome segregation protein SMC [Gloeocapsa sp. DLM2.Bin57]